MGRPPGTATATILAALLMAACSSGESSPSVRSVPIAGPAPSEVRSAGRRLVGQHMTSTNEVDVVTSADGRRWRRVDLPGAPAQLAGWLGLAPTAAGLAFTARGVGPMIGGFPGPSGPPYTWFTADGIRWQGGSLAASSPPMAPPSAAAPDGVTTVVGFKPDLHRYAVSRLTKAGRWVASPVRGLTLAGDDSNGLGENPQIGAGWVDDGRWVLGLDFSGQDARRDKGRAVSDDRGRTWRYEVCEPADASRCADWQSGAGLYFRGEQVSTDGGRTWRHWTHPSIHGYGLYVTGVVHDDDGYVMTANLSTEGDSTYGYLLASDDGVRWHSVAPDPCTRLASGDRPNGTFAPPVALDGRWWTTYHCGGIGSAYATRLLSGTTDGTRWQVSDLTLPRRAEGLFRVDDHLVSLVLDESQRATRFVELRP